MPLKPVAGVQFTDDDERHLVRVVAMLVAFERFNPTPIKALPDKGNDVT